MICATVEVPAKAPRVAEVLSKHRPAIKQTHRLHLSVFSICELRFNQPKKLTCSSACYT